MLSDDFPTRNFLVLDVELGYHIQKFCLVFNDYQSFRLVDQAARQLLVGIDSVDLLRICTLSNANLFWVPRLFDTSDAEDMAYLKE